MLYFKILLMHVFCGGMKIIPSHPVIQSHPIVVRDDMTSHWKAFDKYFLFIVVSKTTAMIEILRIWCQNPVSSSRQIQNGLSGNSCSFFEVLAGNLILSYFPLGREIIPLTLRHQTLKYRHFLISLYCFSHKILNIYEKHVIFFKYNADLCTANYTKIIWISWFLFHR